MDWHLVRCGTTDILPSVSKSLSALIGPVLGLYHSEIIISHGKKIVRRYPLFITPYLFVAWETNDAELWHKVRRTRGVVSIVGGERPAIISEYEVEAWRALADETGTVSLKLLNQLRYKLGDSVMFTGGAFEERQGLFAGYRGNLLNIKIPFLGNEVIVSLAANMVRRCEREPALEASRARPRRKARGGADNQRRHPEVVRAILPQRAERFLLPA